MRPANEATTRLPAIAATLAGIIALARIIHSYSIYSQTFDEPAHIACGLEWWARRTWTLELLHPPIARICAAALLYFNGATYPPTGGFFKRGDIILGAVPNYMHNLTLARLGVLPFFVILLVVVWLWSRELYGNQVAAMAVVLTTLLPSLIAHAGLATTDLPSTAMLVAAFYAITRWAEAPSMKTSLIAGLICSAALLTKFSAVLYLPAGFIVIVAVIRPKQVRARDVAAAIATAWLFAWALYHFSFWPPLSQSIGLDAWMDHYFGPTGALHDSATFFAQHIRLPPPELFLGIGQVIAHNQSGNGSFLLGRFSPDGFAAYYPVVLAVKTPIGFLLLAAIGIVIAMRMKGEAMIAPLIAIVAVTAASLLSHINIGVRHVLLFYPLLAIPAAAAVVKMRRPWATVLIAWIAISSIWFWNDPIPYHNELAPSGLATIVVDSDLDWGQDLLRLQKRMGSQPFHLAYFGTAIPAQLGINNATDLVPSQPVTGLVAISETTLNGVYEHPHDSFAWLRKYQPIGHAGRSIRIYDIPPGK